MGKTTSTNSAPPVEQKYQFALHGEDIKFNTIKCGPCNSVTPHQWLMIIVEPTITYQDTGNSAHPVGLMGLARRLILCQNCGNLRLIK